MKQRFIPEVLLAIHIELKLKSKTDRRAFTIDSVSKIESKSNCPIFVETVKRD